MNPFEMVVVIVIVIALSRVVTASIRAKHQSVNHDALDDAMDRIDDLEERVRVLERVVTDDRYDLKRQIDDLKD